MPRAGLEPARPEGHPILSRARLTSFATPADRTLVPARERVRLRHLERRRPDRDDDLLVRTQHVRGGIAGALLAADPPVHRTARTADAARREAHAPLPEELAERERPFGRRLDVHDPARVVRVQLGDELALEVDADERRHPHMLP